MQHAECSHAARHHRPRLKWLTILAGLASLVWFLVRVIPKPSRAFYPCQRAAAPLASGFVIYLVALPSIPGVKHSRYALAALVLAGAVVALWLPLAFTDDAVAQEAFVPYFRSRSCSGAECTSIRSGAARRRPPRETRSSGFRRNSIREMRY